MHLAKLRLYFDYIRLHWILQLDQPGSRLTSRVKELASRHPGAEFVDALSGEDCKVLGFQMQPNTGRLLKLNGMHLCGHHVYKRPHMNAMPESRHGKQLLKITLWPVPSISRKIEVQPSRPTILDANTRMSSRHVP